MRDRRQRSFRRLIEGDIEMLPLMNIFIVLIPMLLLSAVFVEISVHDLSLPSSAEEPDQKPEEERLGLAVHITDAAYVIRGKTIRSMVIERGAPEADAAEASADAGDETDEGFVGPEGELRDALAQLASDHPDTRDIRIVSEATTRYQEIISVMDISRDAGLPEVALLGSDVEGM